MHKSGKFILGLSYTQNAYNMTEAPVSSCPPFSLASFSFLFSTSTPHSTGTKNVCVPNNYGIVGKMHAPNLSSRPIIKYSPVLTGL